MAISLIIALLLGAVIYMVYSKFYVGVIFSRSFAVTLVGMTLLTCMVTLAISTNIVISLGMVGALSIVRFRTAVKIRQRLTAVPLTTQDILQRTLLPLNLPRSAKFSLHMQSVLQSLFQLWLTHSAHQNIQTKNWQTLLKRYLTAVRSLSSDSSSSRKQSISHLPLTVIWAEKNSVLNGKRQIRLTSF